MMTKFLKVLTIGIIGISLIACSGKKETVTECVSPEDNEQKMVGQQTSTFEAKGNKIIRENNRILYTYQLDKEDDKETIEENITEFVKNFKEHLEEIYGSLKGVAFEITKKDLTVTILLTIDYEIADLQELVDADIVEASESGKIDFISLEATTESLEKENYTCTVK